MLAKTIVTGVDGMEGGRDALRLAAVLAAVLDAEVVAVSAFPYFHRPALSGSPVVEAQRRATREKLESELGELGIRARMHVLADSSPGRALQRIAEKENAAMIVVGSTRRSLVGRVLIGDDALGAVHGSPVPVAVAPRDYAPGDGGLQLIGVGYDGGPEARDALDVAAGLANASGARLELLSVAPNSSAMLAEAGSYSLDWLEDVRAEREQMLQEVVDGLSADAVGSAVLGISSEELEDLSRRVDLLVVGSRGWGPVRRVLLGSTSAGIMRRAACPVLVVPRGAATGQPGESSPSEPGAEPSVHA